MNISASASGVTAGRTDISSMLVDVNGSATAHRLQARLAGQNWNARTAGAGSLIDDVWSGRVDEFEFIPGELGLWRLRTPAEVRYGADGYSVSQLCLTRELSSICGAVSVSGSAADSLSVSAINFDLGILAPFIPQSVAAKGLISAEAELTNFSSSPRGEIFVEADDAQLDFLLGEDLQQNGARDVLA